MNFIIKIDPDASNHGDIAPAYTPPVLVRSKRNKRYRFSSTSKELVKAVSSSQTMTPSPFRPLTPKVEDRSMSHIPHSHGYSSSVTTIDGMPLPLNRLSSSSISHLTHAMAGLLQWSEEIVNGLSTLKWQVVGYAQHVDGSINYAHPHHAMVNPNKFVDRMLTIFSNETKGHLQTLLTAVEQTQTSAADRDGSNPVDCPVQYHPSYFDPGSDYLHHPHRQLHSPPHSPLRSYAYDRPIFPPNSNTSLTRHSHTPDLPAHPQYIPTHPIKKKRKRTRTSSSPQVLPPLSQQYQESHTVANHVHYLLAKQFTCLYVPTKFGFPAYNRTKRLLGFYVEYPTDVGLQGLFVPISKHAETFQSHGIQHHAFMKRATYLLEEDIAKCSQAVHTLTDWESLSAMVEHALVYDWTKGMTKGTHMNSSSSGEVDVLGGEDEELEEDDELI